MIGWSLVFLGLLHLPNSSFALQTLFHHVVIFFSEFTYALFFLFLSYYFDCASSTDADSWILWLLRLLFLSTCVEIFNAWRLGLLLNLNLLFGLSINITHSAQVAVTLVVFHFVVISRPLLLSLFGWRIRLFFICLHAAQLLRRWRPDANFHFILFRDIHFILAVFRLRQSFLLACFQLLRQHGLYVSLRIILFKRAFGILWKDEFVVDLVSVHLVENERSLKWLINSINRLPIFYGEFGLNRVFRRRQAFITMHDVRFPINWFWNLLGWHEFRSHIRVLWLFLLEIWWFFCTHFLHDFVITLFFQLTAELGDESLQFPIIFLHFCNAVVLNVVFGTIFVVSLALYTANLCLFEDLDVVFKLIVLI